MNMRLGRICGMLLISCLMFSGCGMGETADSCGLSQGGKTNMEAAGRRVQSELQQKLGQCLNLEQHQVLEQRVNSLENWIVIRMYKFLSRFLRNK